MRHYERCRAKEISDELMLLLGGYCCVCGATRKLQFNHIYERTWVANRFNRYQRMLRYRKEHALGLIDLRCKRCNNKYKPLPLTDTNTPF